MKIISIYVLLAFLTLSLIVLVDLLTGVSFMMSMHSLYSVFATVTLQEACFMIPFAVLPFFTATTGTTKRNNSPQK